MDDENFQSLCQEAGNAYDKKRIPEQAIYFYLKANAWDKARQLIKKRGNDLVIYRQIQRPLCLDQPHAQINHMGRSMDDLFF